MVIKICLVSQAERTLSIGAASLSERDFSDKIRENSANQIEVTFLLGDPSKIGNRSTENIIFLKKMKYLPRIISYPLICLINSSTLLHQDIFIVPGISIDGFLVCLFCKIFKKKSIITIHGHYEDEWVLKRRYSEFKLLRARFYERSILHFSDLIIVNDDDIQKKLIEKGVNPSKILIRYVSVDIQKFFRENINPESLKSFKNKYQIPNKIILFVGHLTEWDGIFDFIQVIKKLLQQFPEYHFLIVGNNSNIDKAKSLINENGLENQAILTGNVDFDAMPYVYFSSDIVILPLYPPQAGVGSIIIEALSMEVPVITTDIGIFYKVVKNNETGYIVPVGDVDQMVSKAMFLLKDQAVRSQYGKNGRALVRDHYTQEDYIKNWVNSVYYCMNK
jgi:glycosyltransferase involved in cell wall biosynthesis